MRVTLVAFLLFVAVQGVGSAPQTDDLAAVRTRYASAAYEDVLTYLKTLQPDAVTAELEQYRALCLLALGRTEEGEQAFARLVRRSPLYQIPETDVSPRIYAVFRAVRRRTLPEVIREMYASGKTAFENKRYDAAAGEIRDVLRVLDDPDAAAEAAALADLRQLAEGFLRLSEAELALDARKTAMEAEVAKAEAARLAEAAPPVDAAPPVPGDGLSVSKIVVYSSEDVAITPPVEIERFMPPWNPPAAMARFLEYRGELEVIVSETGRVQQARIIRPTIPSYDVSLTAAAEQRWRFEPARRQGQSVPYRLTFEIVLTPSR